MKNPDFDFENFKVHSCKNQVCKFSMEEQLFLNYAECFDYHKEEDRRRKVTYSENCFNYSPKYYYDSNDNHLTFCKNSFEYYYHPLNYKTKKCEKERCNVGFCPFFHRNDEKDFFENFRKKFQNAKIQTLFDDVTNLCQKLTENLKITETPPIVKTEIDIPEFNSKFNQSITQNANNANNNNNVLPLPLPELFTKKAESTASNMVNKSFFLFRLIFFILINSLKCFFFHFFINYLKNFFFFYFFFYFFYYF